MAGSPSLPRLGPERSQAALLAAGAVAGCVLLAAVDPNQPGRYPTCPTRSLLGFDCPACGTLRGLHSLTRGRVWEALDHNLLLLVAVPVGLLFWLGWIRMALGRSRGGWSPPAWGVPVVVVVAVAFAVARNLPVDALRWLDSAA